jgi:hypothetical protein
MKKFNIGIIDLVAQGPTQGLWAKMMFPNYASIMPQVIGVWCEKLGHNVDLICYTGSEDLHSFLSKKFDLVFISTFTQSALLSYALSNIFRQKNIPTVIGGPHAKCFSHDAKKYFDYVIGLFSFTLLQNLLGDFRRQEVGIYLEEKTQPDELPSLEERWKFCEDNLGKAPLLKLIPMISGLGCPYECNFCIDATTPYSQLNFDGVTKDLIFLKTKMKKPKIGWHDSNFGVKFNQIMDAIEKAAPLGSFESVAESSLSLLNEDRLKRLKRNGFTAILPGIESWYSTGNKTKTIKILGLEKVKQISEQINIIQKYIPYIQTNFVFGLDCDYGDEPFELTKEFLIRSPGAFPAYSLITCFGDAAPINHGLQQQGRVLPIPFHFLNTHRACNVLPLNYEVVEFYEKFLDLLEFTFSAKMTLKRFLAVADTQTKFLNLVRAISSEGLGKIKYYKMLIHRLKNDKSVYQYFSQGGSEVPEFLVKKIKDDLGIFWTHLPKNALIHNPNTYEHPISHNQTA